MTKEKNKKISDTLAATRAKRKTQSCKTFRFKIDWNNLNRKEKEQIKLYQENLLLMLMTT